MISAAKRFTVAALLIAGLLAAIEPASAQIVAIGASNVAGRGVSTPEAWPAQLEGMLAGKGRSVHVTNAGMNGDTNAGMLARLGSSVPDGTKIVLLDEVGGGWNARRMVTGVAVGFALDIGFSSQDVKRLGMAATLHDIGKARIPLSILDKPGRLDASEEEIMRRHPVIGCELLQDTPGISPDILDGVRHHHEYLDGSGYPDALTARQISDLVRLLTISDIFAAPIESRPYSPPISRQDAFRILCGMDGKLERPLVRAFRNVALVP